MYRGKQIAVVVPAFNAALHLRQTIQTAPDYVDHIVVVDDGSTDQTSSVARLAQTSASTNTVVLLRHSENRGVGAAIATGYEEALRRNAHVVAVMAGDGQMDPRDLKTLLNPIIDRRAEYTKGNRFRHPDVWRAMPTTRLIGNTVLSLLTRLTSGYHHVFDSQCGYTAIARTTLLSLPKPFFEGYGYPNDLLARLRCIRARVVDVPVRPIYEGQTSGIRVRTVIYPILFVLLRSLARRLRFQYFDRRQRERLTGPSS